MEILQISRWAPGVKPLNPPHLELDDKGIVLVQPNLFGRMRFVGGNPTRTAYLFKDMTSFRLAPINSKFGENLYALELGIWSKEEKIIVSGLSEEDAELVERKRAGYTGSPSDKPSDPDQENNTNAQTRKTDNNPSLETHREKGNVETTLESLCRQHRLRLVLAFTAQCVRRLRNQVIETDPRRVPEAMEDIDGNLECIAEFVGHNGFTRGTVPYDSEETGMFSEVAKALVDSYQLCENTLYRISRDDRSEIMLDRIEEDRKTLGSWASELYKATIRTFPNLDTSLQQDLGKLTQYSATVPKDFFVPLAELPKTPLTRKIESLAIRSPRHALGFFVFCMKIWFERLNGEKALEPATMAEAEQNLAVIAGYVQNPEKQYRAVHSPELAKMVAEKIEDYVADSVIELQSFAQSFMSLREEYRKTDDIERLQNYDFGDNEAAANAVPEKLATFAGIFAAAARKPIKELSFGIHPLKAEIMQELNRLMP